MVESVVIDGLDEPEYQPDPIDQVGLLLVRTADGDRDAFSQLYDLMAPRMLGLIVRILVDRAQSEEVLQEVLLEAWQSASRFAPNKGRGRTWLLTIAHRRAIDRVRASQSATDRDIRVGRQNLGVAYDAVAEQAELHVEAEQVNAALADLSDTQRETLMLAYFGGYSQSEIAVLTGTPLGTVKTRMRDGLARLRDRLGVRT
ncbi:ECF RNA polymerase sigma factor SigK [Diaminobutyricibacter sp. McL0618]|uniref:ECF RNA polymerase sigma factor SigK n=1 Tax=Leifsonia sp. McL0618 TaxID=3415677 RepID=UPI003CF12EC1